jgi:hypothetical protein
LPCIENVLKRGAEEEVLNAKPISCMFAPSMSVGPHGIVQVTIEMIAEREVNFVLVRYRNAAFRVPATKLTIIGIGKHELATDVLVRIPVKYYHLVCLVPEGRGEVTWLLDASLQRLEVVKSNNRCGSKHLAKHECCN